MNHSTNGNHYIGFKNFLKNFNATSFILLVLLGVQLGYSLWALNKGFDFTDEAHAYLGFDNPNEVTHVATYYAVFVSDIFGWIGINIVKIRILRLLFIVLCGLIFAMGISTWLKRFGKLTNAQHTNLVLFILLGSFLVNATGSQSITYNLSTTFLLQFIFGAILYLDQRGYKISAVDEVIFSIVGALLFVLFAIKFSVAISVAGITVVLIFTTQKDIKTLAVHCISMLLGSLISGIVLFGSNLLVWVTNYTKTLTFVASLTVGSIASKYSEDFSYTMSSKIVSNLSAVIVVLGLLLVNSQSQKKIIKVGSVIILTLVLIQLIVTHTYYLGGPKHYYLFTGLYIILVFILLVYEGTILFINRYRKQASETGEYKIVILLLLIPVIGAIGTNNLLSIQIIWYSSFLFGAIYILLTRHDGFFLASITMLIGVNASVQAVSGLVHFPYRINKTLYEESVPIQKVGRGEPILVNKETAKSLEQASSLIHLKTKYSSGDPIFSFSPDYYGFIYLLDGTLPGWGWYDEKGTELNCYNLNHSLCDLRKMIVLSPSYYQMDDSYLNCFDKLDINLNRDYENLGTISYFMGDLDRSFSVYAPKQILK